MRRVVDYLTLLIVLFISGHPIYTLLLSRSTVLPLVSVLIFAIYFKRYGFLKSKNFLLYLVLFNAIFLAQYLQFGLFVTTFIGFSLVLYIAHVTARLRDFSGMFINIMTIIVSVSLLFFSIQLVFGQDSIPAIRISNSTIFTSFFYNYVVEQNVGLRNSGFFWEPGAFQGYIIIALLLLISKDGFVIYRSSAWKTTVLLAGLLSTVSTTGYVALFFLLSYSVYRSTVHPYTKYVVALPVVLILVFLVYRESAFLSEKIEQQIVRSLDVNGDQFLPDRFSVFLFDINYIVKNPLFGNGFDERTRFEDHPKLIGEKLGHGNGLSHFVASMGFAGIALFIFGILSANAKHAVVDRVFICLLLVLMLNGQHYLNYPLYWVMMFYKDT